MGTGRSLVAVVLIGIATLPAACGDGGKTGGAGGSGGGGSCLQVQPCGGSLVGSWTVRSSCDALLLVTAGIECPGTTLDESMLVTSGTLRYNADLTYTSSVTWSGTIKMKLDVACIGFADCDAYVTPKNMTQTYGVTSCTSVGGTVCDCAFVYSGPYVKNESGTYSTSGDTLTTTLSSAPQNPYSQPYCVQGSELHLLTALGGPPFTADLVATR